MLLAVGPRLLQPVQRGTHIEQQDHQERSEQRVAADAIPPDGAAKRRRCHARPFAATAAVPSTTKSGPSRILGVAAQLLLDSQQLVVLGDPIRAPGSARLDL